MKSFLLIGLAVLAVACARQEPPAAEDAASADAGTGQAAAQRAYIDPETGELTVPPTDQKSDAAERDRSSPKYSFETRPDGVTVMRPKNPTSRTLNAEKAEDGSLEYEETANDD